MPAAALEVLSLLVDVTQSFEERNEMKHYLTTLCLTHLTVGGLTLIFAYGALADDPPKGPPRGKKREEIIKRFDKDGDGKLNDEEKRAAREAFMKMRGGKGRGGPPQFNREEILKKFDKNGDGKLDDDERKAAREAFMKKRGGKGRGGRPQFNREEILKKFDKNGDGKLDDDERKAAREAFMKKRGGKGRGGRPQFNREEIIKKFDKDGDGKLNDEERKALREAFMKRRGGKGGGGKGRPGGPGARIDRAELLKKFDANGDGKLDDDERAKAREALRKKRRDG